MSKTHDPIALADLAKVELHVHLDCSLSYEFLAALHQDLDREQFEHDYALVSRCRDLSEFLQLVPRSLRWMQTAERLRLSVLDLARQLLADQVIYAEIRFAPLLHCESGLQPDEVVDCVCSALREAVAETGVHLRLILCTLRHFSLQQSMTTASLVANFYGRGVVGFDLAADEAGFPLDHHIEAFRILQRKGIPCTAHAGEAKGADSVRETLARLSPQRIGHGVRSIEDDELVRELAKSGVHLEVCPSCNVLIDVFEDLPSHPVDRLLQAGVSLGINTDGRTIPLLTLGGQYAALQAAFGWGVAEFEACNKAALKAAFCPDELKQSLRKQLVTPNQDR